MPRDRNVTSDPTTVPSDRDADVDEIEVLRRFAERHMTEYGDPEVMLAVLRVREQRGLDPVVPDRVVDTYLEILRAGGDVRNDVHGELTRYLADHVSDGLTRAETIADVEALSRGDLT